MFTLFYSLYFAMFLGQYVPFGLPDIKTKLSLVGNALGEWTTSLFNNVDTPMTNLGDVMFDGIYPNWMALVSFILALITSIGIVVMAVKGIKRVFGVFFMGIR